MSKSYLLKPIFSKFPERDKVAFAGNEHARIHYLRSANRVRREAHVPIGFFGPAEKFLQIFFAGFYSEIQERVNERLFLAGLGANYVAEGAHELASVDGLLQKFLEIQTAPEKRACRVVHVLRVYENRDALVFGFNQVWHFL